MLLEFLYRFIITYKPQDANVSEPTADGRGGADA